MIPGPFNLRASLEKSRYSNKIKAKGAKAVEGDNLSTKTTEDKIIDAFLALDDALSDLDLKGGRVHAAMRALQNSFNNMLRSAQFEKEKP